MTRTPRYTGHVLALYRIHRDGEELLTWAWLPAAGPETAEESNRRIRGAGVRDYLHVGCSSANSWMEPGGFSSIGGPDDLGEPDTPESWLRMLNREVGIVRRSRGLRPGGPEKLGYKPLAPGEASIRVRIRGPAAALQAFESLTAEKRGEVIATALTSRAAGDRGG